MYSGTNESDQIVRLVLSGSVFFLKVSGQASVELLKFISAAASEESKASGKVRLKSLLQSGSELKVFTLQGDERFNAFRDAAKDYGVKYSVVKRHGEDKEAGIYDIMVKAEDASKINRIIEKYSLVEIAASVTATKEDDRTQAEGQNSQDKTNDAVQNDQVNDQKHNQRKSQFDSVADIRDADGLGRPACIFRLVHANPQFRQGKGFPLDLPLPGIMRDGKQQFVVPFLQPAFPEAGKGKRGDIFQCLRFGSVIFNFRPAADNRNAVIKLETAVNNKPGFFIGSDKSQLPSEFITLILITVKLQPVSRSRGNKFRTMPLLRTVQPRDLYFHKAEPAFTFLRDLFRIKRQSGKMQKFQRLVLRLFQVHINTVFMEFHHFIHSLSLLIKHSAAPFLSIPLYHKLRDKTIPIYRLIA